MNRAAVGLRSASRLLVALASIAASHAVFAADQVGYDPVAVGQKLFSDRRLSADGSISCASCHMPDRAFSDGRKVATGLHGQQGVRNTPSLTTVGLHQSFSWDGRRQSLEAQVLAPLLNQQEHGFHSRAELVASIRAANDYPAEFRAEATTDRIAAALAAYVRSLGAGSSRFDRFWSRHDQSALSDSERRGFEIFRGPIGCSDCHVIDSARASFTDDKFHAVALSRDHLADLAQSATRSMHATPAELDRMITSDAAVAALGRFNVTHKPVDIGKYRTPSLRNVALTSPYMHDGSVESLEQAVDAEVYYRSAQQKRPLILTPRERADVVAFLHSLTSENLEGRQ